MSDTAPHEPAKIVAFTPRPMLPTWKRVIDIAVCIAALPVLFPLAALMLFISRRYAPGPIFFRQERVGFRGQHFTMFKFRTMKVNSDSSTHREHIRAAIRAGKPLEKIDSKGDSRLVPFGRLLRATGLDELPQIINVLRGEMSIIGPRPCVAYEAELFSEDQRARFDAVPGITGLWQVSGKNSLTLAQMIELDIKYARTLSPASDLLILAKTVPTTWKLVMDAVRSSRAQKSGGKKGVARKAAGSWSSAVGSRIIARDARRQYVQFRLPSVVEICAVNGESASRNDHIA